MKMAKIIFVSLLFAALCMPLMGKGAGEKRGEGTTEQVLRFNIEQEPSILDPFQYRDDKASSIIYAIHEPLFRISSEGKGWEPGLATDYTANEDASVYTVNMRQNAKWADGSAITSDDVVYSFQRAVSPELANEKAFDYYEIANAEEVFKGEKDISDLGVKALDRHTVEFTLKRPLDYFPDLMRMTGFAPIQKKSGEEFEAIYGTEVDKIMASGPFKMFEWEHNTKIVLLKNENYWDASKVELQRIDITLITDMNAVAGMYKIGDLDFMEVVSDYFPQYKDSTEFHTMPLTRVNFIEFNPGKEFLSNIKIREALSIAFNRTVYVEDVIRTNDLPAYGMIPPGLKGRDNGDFRMQAGDIVIDASSGSASLQRAQKLFNAGLAEIGKTSKDMEEALRILCIDTPEHKKRAQAIQQMWNKALGINIPLIPMQVKMLIPLLMNTEFDIVVGGGRTGLTSDPAYFIDFIYYENKWNDGYYKDLIERSLVARGNERVDLLMKAEKYILDNFVFIPQNYTVSNYVLKNSVEGLRHYPSNLRFDFKYTRIVN